MTQSRDLPRHPEMRWSPALSVHGNGQLDQSKIRFIGNESLNVQSCVVDERGNSIHADSYMLKLKRMKTKKEDLVKGVLRAWLSTQEKSSAS